MRPIIILCLLVLLSGAAFGQNPKPYRQVPDSIYNGFTRIYGKNHYKYVSNLKWDLDQRRYRAKFNIKNDNYAITYNPDGSVYKEMRGIKTKDLPDNVYAEAMKHGNILHAWKVYHAGAYNSYEYYIETDSMLLSFDTFGQLIAGKPTH